MDINGVTYDPSIMTAMSFDGQTPPPPPPEIPEGEKDEYIPSGVSFDGAIPTGTYNASGMMVGDDLDLLTDAMNDGAESLDFPTIDNMDEVLANLMDYIQKQQEETTTVASTEASASSSDM